MMENLTQFERDFINLLRRLDNQQRQDLMRIMEAFKQLPE